MPSNENCRDKEYRKIVKKVRKSYDSLAKFFDFFYPPLEFNYNQFANSLNEYLQEQGVKKVLDCACGTGRTVIPLSKTGSYDLIVGADLSHKMINQAKNNSKGLDIEWVQCEWLDLPDKLKYNDFDAILCLGNPLTHIPPWSYQLPFSKMIKLLRPGGIMIINKRNWEAELGVGGFQKGKPKTTIFWPTSKNEMRNYPRISLLNIYSKDGSELFLFFTYHQYDNKSRLQLLHLHKVRKNGSVLKKAFRFRCFYVWQDRVEEALQQVGFSKIDHVDIADIDIYAEEIFIVASK